jgi:hypothetical protein
MTSYRPTMCRRHRAALKIAFMAAVALLVGSLGTAATPASASTPKLSAILLDIGQMPTGWVVDSAGGNGLGCLANILEPKGVKQTAKASVEFDDNGSLPGVAEGLATFSNAITGYKKIDSKLNACKRLSGTSGGQRFNGTVGQMSFPHYGNASAAFQASITIEGSIIAEDIVIVRKGTIVMGLDEGNLASVKVSQFQGFVKKAVAKIR